MAPGKEDKENLAEDVWSCDVEVVFQGTDGHVAVYLCKFSRVQDARFQNE